MAKLGKRLAEWKCVCRLWSTLASGVKAADKTAAEGGSKRIIAVVSWWLEGLERAGPVQRRTEPFIIMLKVQQK